ncbi:hypothetical protein K469DRAFT_5960 [Zopfia rhizophila CBS 207.26]|uniref:Uncharacterized protein n=1 Tax=Zopfia rhizophila CBS 207.26 TaxID=1314779 RepID=A0A6A6EVD3_9PEZI|nr:hypothetical protein K469DRAFT_5960 [Zopfia rhizophila CBS 207.26]
MRLGTLYAIAMQANAIPIPPLSLPTHRRRTPSFPPRLQHTSSSGGTRREYLHAPYTTDLAESDNILSRHLYLVL